MDLLTTFSVASLSARTGSARVVTYRILRSLPPAGRSERERESGRRAARARARDRLGDVRCHRRREVGRRWAVSSRTEAARRRALHGQPHRGDFSSGLRVVLRHAPALAQHHPQLPLGVDGHAVGDACTQAKHTSHGHHSRRRTILSNHRVPDVCVSVASAAVACLPCSRARTSPPRGTSRALSGWRSPRRPGRSRSPRRC